MQHRLVSEFWSFLDTRLVYQVITRRSCHIMSSTLCLITKSLVLIGSRVGSQFTHYTVHGEVFSRGICFLREVSGGSFLEGTFIFTGEWAIRNLCHPATWGRHSTKGHAKIQQAWRTSCAKRGGSGGLFCSRVCFNSSCQTRHIGNSYKSKCKSRYFTNFI